MQGQNFQAPINIATIELPSSANYFEEDGQYKCIVEKAEFRAAKNNQTNVMLALTLKCIEGKFEGRRSTHNLNLYNQNPDAQRIAYAELAAYATAMGADPMLQNTAQLCGKPFCVYVTVTKQEDANDPNKKYTNNKFSDWAYADGSPIVKGQFGASQSAANAGGYAQPGAAPAAPAAPVAPAAPQAPAAPAAPVAPAVPAQPQYAAPAAPAAPQAPAAPAAPGFAPPPGAAPFAPQQ